jgi:hypothetical protein
MRAERDDGLTREILFRQKDPDRRGHRAPPVGVADKHHVILPDIFDLCFQRRPVAGIQFLPRLVDHHIVILRIRFHGLDLKDIAACDAVDLICDLTGMAAVGKISYQDLSVPRGRPGFLFACLPWMRGTRPLSSKTHLARYTRKCKAYGNERQDEINSFHGRLLSLCEERMCCLPSKQDNNRLISVILQDILLQNKYAEHHL